MSKESIILKNKRYREKHKEAIKIRQKIYRDNNKDLLLKKRKQLKKDCPWIFSYYKIKQRCNNPNNPKYHRYGGRGIKALLSKNDLKKLWHRDKAWLLKKPSIDRIDNNGNYEYSNCRYIEIGENAKLGRAIPVYQYNKKMILLNVYSSVMEAFRKTNIIETSIYNNISGLSKHAGGYIWKREVA